MDLPDLCVIITTTIVHSKIASILTCVEDLSVPENLQRKGAQPLETPILIAPQWVRVSKSRSKLIGLALPRRKDHK